MRRCTRTKPFAEWLMLLAGACLLGMAPALVWGQQADPAGKTALETPLRFLRVFVPADEVSDWPRENVPYVPMGAEEFERLLQMAMAAANPAERSPAVLVSGRYSARLCDQQTLAGEAELLVAPNGRPGRSIGLEPCNLAITSAVWLDADSQPAKLGRGAAGGPRLLLEGAERLQLRWSLRAAPQSDPSPTFDFSLPASRTNTVLLDLPQDAAPHADLGVVIDEGTLADSMRRWRIELGGHHRVRVRLVNLAGQAAALLQPRVRQSTIYRVMPDGLEVTSRFQFDVPAGSIDQLALRLDRQLRITGATCNGKPISWRHLPSGDAAEPIPVVLLPEKPLQGDGHTVEVSAVGSTVLGQAWRLPGLAFDGALWLEGSATVLVAPPLVVSQLTPIAGRRQMPVGAPEMGEVFQLQFYEPAGGVELVVGRSLPQWEFEGGTWIQSAPAHTTAQVAVVAEARHEACFSFEAGVQPPWQIESVETIPSDLLAGWDVLANEGDPPGSRLRVELAKPLQPGTKLRLRVTARRNAIPANESFQLGRLLPLALPSARPGSQWAWLGGTGNWTIDPLQASLEVASEETAPSPDLLALFTQPPSGIRVDASGGRERSVRVEGAHGRYRGMVEVTVDVQQERVVQVYRFSCIPESDHLLEQIRLGFSHQHAQPLDWRCVIAGEEKPQRGGGTRDSARFLLGSPPNASPPKVVGQAVIARKLQTPPTEHNDGPRPGQNDAELWEVVLPQPMSAPFEVQAETTWPLQGPTPVALAWLCDAIEQQAAVSIRSDRPVALQADRQQMLPVPCEDRAAESRANRWPVSVFRYEPPEEGASLHAALSIAPWESGEAAPFAWVRWCRAQSWYESSGLGHHLVAYELETRGRWRLAIELPFGVNLPDVDGVWVNGVEASTELGNGPLALELPDDTRFVSVWLAFRSRETPLGAFARRQPPIPKPNVPVLECQWTAWLPPGYQMFPWQQANEPNWLRLLAGPLARPAYLRPFDPLSAAAWQELLGNREVEPADTEALHSLLTVLAAACASGTREGTPGAGTWGSLLSEAAAQMAENGRAKRGEPTELLIDRAAMARSGIAPTVTVNAARLPQTTVAPEEHALELLRENGLAVVLYPGLLVLTDLASATEAAQTPSFAWAPAHPPANTLLGPGRAGTFGVVFQGTATSGAEPAAPPGWHNPWHDPALVPAEVWAALPQGNPGPWQSLRLPGQQPTDWRGWNPYRQSFPVDIPPTLVVVHQARVAAAHWVAFLAAAALGVCCLRRPPAVVGLAGIAAMAALWLPIPLVGIASGVLLGLLAAVGLAVVRRSGNGPERRDSRTGFGPGSSAKSRRLWPGERLETDADSAPAMTGPCTASPANPADGPAGSRDNAVGEQSSDQPHPHPSPDAGAWRSRPPGNLPLLMLALIVACAGHVVAQDVAHREEKPRTYRVLIPMGEDRQPSGDKYQLPEGFYNELVRRAEAVSDRWLIEAAWYEANLTQDAESGRIALPRLEVRYRLRVLAAPAQIPIPVGFEQSRLLADRLRLDGRTIPATWDSTGRALLVNTTQSGVHEVRFEFSPPTESRDDWSVLDLPVAAVCDSQLELALPAEPVEVELPSALGQTSSDPDGRVFRAVLGPTERLLLRWKSRSGKRSPLQAEELLWLKLGNGPVVLNARLKLQSDSPLPETLRIAVDPHLQLVSGSTDARLLEAGDSGQPPIVEVRIAAGTSSAQAAGENAATVDLQFMLVPGSGVGRTLLPEFNLLGGRVTRRWLAVSVEQGIEWRHELYEPLEVVAPTAFAQAWQSETAPLAAWSLPNNTTGWSVLAWPSSPIVAAQQRVAVCYGRRTAQVVFDAQLSLQDAWLFDQSISAPPELEVHSVRAVHQQLDWPVRWSKLPSGRINVFFDRPITNQCRLTIHGELPANANARNSVPVLRVEGAADSPLTWDLFRRSDTLVEIGAADDLNRVASNETPRNTFVQGIPVGTFQATTAGGASPAVVVRANQPSIRVQQQTVVRQSEGEWWADVHLQFHVADGVADRFSVLASDSGPQPWTAEPPATVKLLETRNDGAQLLAIFPPTPVTGTWQTRLTIPILLQGAQELVVPNVVPQYARIQEHLLLLPQEVAGQPARWQLSRLRPTELPQQHLQRLAGSQRYGAYLATGRHPRAALLLPAGRQAIPLMEIAGTPLGGRVWALRVHVLALPEGSPQCNFSLLPNCQILEASVNGLPIWPQQLGDNMWGVPLESGRSPCWIDLLLVVQTGVESSSLIHLAAPKVEGFEVKRVVWRFALPDRFRVQPPPVGSSTVQPASVWEVTRIQLEALLAAASRSTQLLGHDNPQSERWVARWLFEWEEASSRTLRSAGAHSEQAGPAQQAAAKQAELLRKQGEPLAKQWQLAVGNARSGAAYPSSGWEHQAVESAPLSNIRVEYWWGNGVDALVQLVSSETPSSPNPQLMAAAAVLLVLVFASALPGVRSATSHFLCRWPHSAGTLFGITWWLWLRPSVLGWVIVACSLIGLFRSAFWSCWANKTTVIRVP